MSSFSLDAAISAGLWIAIKASVLLGVAAILQAVMYRRASAAMRHLVWTLTIVGLLLLPVVSVVLPEWAVVIRPAATKPADAAPLVDRLEDPAALVRPLASLAESAESAPVVRTVIRLRGFAATADKARLRGLAALADTFSWSSVIATVYAVGVLAMLIHLAIQRWRVQRLARQATDPRDQEWTRLLRECVAGMGVHRLVRLLQSRECNMPMAFGTRRPTILIPATNSCREHARRHTAADRPAQASRRRRNEIAVTSFSTCGRQSWSPWADTRKRANISKTHQC